MEQAFKIERRRENLYGEILSEEIVYGVTSIEARRACAENILTIVREHWVIENSCNYVKDVTLGEDACRVKDRSSSQFFSVLRNMSINIFRKLGFVNIAKGKRFFQNHDKELVLRAVGII